MHLMLSGFCQISLFVLNACWDRATVRRKEIEDYSVASPWTSGHGRRRRLCSVQARLAVAWCLCYLNKCRQSIVVIEKVSQWIVQCLWLGFPCTENWKRQMPHGQFDCTKWWSGGISWDSKWIALDTIESWQSRSVFADLYRHVLKWHHRLGCGIAF